MCCVEARQTDKRLSSRAVSLLSCSLAPDSADTVQRILLRGLQFETLFVVRRKSTRNPATRFRPTLLELQINLNSKCACRQLSSRSTCSRRFRPLTHCIRLRTNVSLYGGVSAHFVHEWIAISNLIAQFWGLSNGTSCCSSIYSNFRSSAEANGNKQHNLY